MASTLMTLFFGHPEVDFAYRHTRNGRIFKYLRIGWDPGAGVSPARLARIDKALRAGLRRIGTT